MSSSSELDGRLRLRARFLLGDFFFVGPLAFLFGDGSAFVTRSEESRGRGKIGLDVANGSQGDASFFEDLEAALFTSPGTVGYNSKILSSRNLLFMPQDYD